MIQVKDTNTTWWMHEQAEDYTSAVGSCEWATEISRRELSRGNGRSDYEPPDLADGRQRSVYMGYREEAGTINVSHRIVGG